MSSCTASVDSITHPYYFPFSAIVGQEKMKRALLLNLIDPTLGGVLILGEKGTAKSTIVRALSQLLEGLSVIELPIATTEDKLVGSIDVEHALSTGELRFSPGILARAHKQILYVDEVNLLEDYLVDILLDVAAMGVNHIEREGISHSHPARFTLIGTMNPEEGSLRPQLLDRFALSVEVCGERNVSARCEVLQRRLDYERDPQSSVLAIGRKTKPSLDGCIKLARFCPSCATLSLCWSLLLVWVSSWRLMDIARILCCSRRP